MGGRPGEGSLADVLLLARSVLPEALIDRSGWERLEERAGGLSVSAADASFWFECRLDEAEAGADLLFSVPPDGRFADALVRDGGSGVDGSSAASLAGLLAQLREPASAVAAVIELVALEYDVVGVVDSPAPGFFLRSAAGGGYVDAGLLSRAIALAAGWDDGPAVKSGIARILSNLPPGAAVRWAGAFPGRNRRAVRLAVRAVDRPREFLQRIGWPGDASIVDEIASEFSAVGVRNLVLALDVAEEGVLPGAGVELSRPGEYGASWREALDLMVRRRWCRSDRAAAFGAANRSERIYSPSGVSELLCGIHHVKLTVGERKDDDNVPRDDRVAVVKGYLACALLPRS